MPRASSYYGSMLYFPLCVHALSSWLPLKQGTKEDLQEAVTLRFRQKYTSLPTSGESIYIIILYIYIYIYICHTPHYICTVTSYIMFDLWSGLQPHLRHRQPQQMTAPPGMQFLHLISAQGFSHIYITMADAFHNHSGWLHLLECTFHWGTASHRGKVLTIGSTGAP